MSTLLRAHDLGGLAEWYAADPTRWPARPEFHPDRRWYARLALAGDHEAWLLTWLPGQATDLHDHGGAAGAFTVLEGHLTEATPTGAPRVELAERSDGAVLVDIRPAVQRAATGVIPGAIVVERNHLEWRFDPASDARVPIASYDLRVVVYCQEGYTSSLAAASLQDLGLSRATDLAGGTEAWQAAGLPTTAG